MIYSLLGSVLSFKNYWWGGGAPPQSSLILQKCVAYQVQYAFLSTVQWILAIKKPV